MDNASTHRCESDSVPVRAMQGTREPEVTRKAKKRRQLSRDFRRQTWAEGITVAQMRAESLGRGGGGQVVRGAYNSLQHHTEPRNTCLNHKNNASGKVVLMLQWRSQRD